MLKNTNLFTSFPAALTWGVLLTALQIAQLCVAVMWAIQSLGIGWLIALAIFMIIINWSIPIIIGSFFGVIDILGWHWGFALMFVAPAVCMFICADLLLVGIDLVEKLTLKTGP